MRYSEGFKASIVRKAQDGSDGIQPSHRHPGEKLALLLESKTISADSKGEWLRGHGLQYEHLSLWEQELTTMTNDKADKSKDENVKLRKENKRLQKELAEKEKALADAAVLLMLKKKYQRLFEEGGES